MWQRGLWGGVVIYGKSVLNTASDADRQHAASPEVRPVFEGLPDNQVVNGQHLNAIRRQRRRRQLGRLPLRLHPQLLGTVILPNKETQRPVPSARLAGVPRIENVEVVMARRTTRWSSSAGQ